MTHTIGIDIACDCPLHAFLDTIHRHHGAVSKFNPSGPAGGNPYVEIAFDDRPDALAYLSEYTGSNDPNDLDVYFK